MKLSNTTTVGPIRSTGFFQSLSRRTAEALAAAQTAAAEQEIPGHRETIEYEDDKGEWHTETVSGRNRPHTIVKDRN
jgi:hypothetical protein